MASNSQQTKQSSHVGNKPSGPPRAYSARLQNPPFVQPQINIAVIFLPKMQSQNYYY